MNLQDSKLKQLIKRSAFIAIIIGLGIVGFILLQPKPTYPTYRLSETSLHKKQNFSQIIDREVYAFNGLAFYKTSLDKESQTTVLRSGLKLPAPDMLIWAGDKGALLHFDQSFSASVVEENLKQSGQRLSGATRDYTWYLDFATGSLRKVIDYPVRDNFALYLPDKQGFYFIPDVADASQFDPNKPLLYFYNLTTGKTDVISRDLGVVDVSYLGRCQTEATKVCLIARQRDSTFSQRLYGIEQDGSTKQILEASGRLLATNDPRLFITSEQNHDDRGESEGIEPDVNFSPRPARLRNIQENTDHKLGFNIGAEDVLVYFTSKSMFIAFDSSLPTKTKGDKTEQFYRVGVISDSGKVSTKTFPLLKSDDALFQDRILGSRSDDPLFTTSTGAEIILNEIGKAPQLNRIAQAETRALLDGCSQSGVVDKQFFEEQSLFKVFFTADSSFAGNVQSFSNCVSQAGSRGLVGYNYYFGTVDPFNGRITSD